MGKRIVVFLVIGVGVMLLQGCTPNNSCKSTNDCVGGWACSSEPECQCTRGFDRPKMITASLPDGIVGTPYAAPLLADNGFPPYSWTVVSGPAWLTVDNQTGALTGTPDAAVTAAAVVLEVMDASCGHDQIVERSFTLDVFYCDAAAASPCSGHGSCDGVHVCQCEAAYRGTQCQDCAALHHREGEGCVADTFCATSSCNDHGSCDDTTGRPVCTCEQGYAGAGCESCDTGYHLKAGACLPDTSCPLGIACSGHGSCDDSTGEAVCTCDAGYQGEVCAACAGGYHVEGDACALDTTCQENSCSGHGSCDDTTGAVVCSCADHWAGAACDHCEDSFHPVGDLCQPDETCPVSNACSGHGACDDTTKEVVCSCELGYQGDLCELCAGGYHSDAGLCVVDQTCQPNTCSGHGSCDDSAGAVACACQPGYSGTFCALCDAAAGYHWNAAGDACTLDPCDPNPCAAAYKTTCTPDGAAAVCSCVEGYQEDPAHACVRYEYQCAGTGCGADAQRRACQGTMCASWVTTEDCAAAAVCFANAQGAGCTACELGCAAGKCNGCTTGDCCDSGTLRDDGYVCKTWSAYRCAGTACGADVERQDWEQRCTGSAGDCTGAISSGSWATSSACADSALCDASGGAPQCAACALGCAYGQCQPTCTGGLANCDQDPRNGCEIDTRSDPLNCGGCGAACDLANVKTHGCASSQCTIVECDAGFGDCDGIASNGCQVPDADDDGYVAVGCLSGTDCDDTNPDISPGELEATGMGNCSDGFDNDCDTLTDRAEPTDCLPVQIDMLATNGTVNAIVPLEFLVYFGGSFTQVGTSTSGFIATDPQSGDVLPDWIKLPGAVADAIHDGSTGYYIFTESFTESAIERKIDHILSDGSPDPNWSFSLVFYNETTVIGANDSNIFLGTGGIGGGISAFSFTDSFLPVWSRSLNDGVNAVLVSDSTVFIGGSYTTMDSKTARHLSSLDSLTGVSIKQDFNVNGNVNALAISGSSLYVGGDFTSVGGQTHTRIAAVDAASGSPIAWNPEANGTVRTIAVSGTTVYIGGDFTTVNGAPRNHVAAIDATSGNLTTWNPDVNGAVSSISLSGSTVYLAGEFTSVHGETRNYLAAIDASTGVPTSWNPNVNSPAFDVIASESQVVAGGGFNLIDWQPRQNLAAIELMNGGLIDWNPSANGTVNAMALAGTTMYVGGGFTQLGALGRNRIGAVDASTGAVTDWNPDANGAVRTIVPYGSSIFVGGDFTSIHSQTKNRLAAISASTGAPTSWPSAATDGSVSTLSISGSTIYAGGSFTSVADPLGYFRNRIAAFALSDGSTSSWDPNANGNVATISAQESVVYVGGGFSTIGNLSGGGVAALDKATGSAIWISPAGSYKNVTAMDVSGSALLVGSWNVAGTNSLNLIDTGTWSSLDWNPAPDGKVNVITAHDKTLYVGGEFSQIDGSPQEGLVRFLLP